MNNPAWKTYTGQLRKRGHGLPLWVPEPLNGDVSIGDVGIMFEGGFMPWFNAITGACYKGWYLPEGFQPLIFPDRLYVSRPRWLLAGQHIVSKHMTVSGGGGRAGVSQVCDLSLQLQTKTKKAAFLIIGGDATQRCIVPSKMVSTYVRKNMDSWVSFASEAGLKDVAAENIIFVEGHVKTSAWAAGAVSSKNLHVDIGLSGGFGPASAGILFNTTQEQRNSLEYRQWPPGDSDMGEFGTPLPSNQCLFLSGYKVKWSVKAFFKKFGFHAGVAPHVGRGIPSPGATSTDNRPLDDLFDYILTHPDVNVAVACDSDLTDLTRGQDWPDNGPEFLNRLKPEISVEDGVGMISQVHAVYRAHFPPALDIVEVEDSAQDGDIPNGDGGGLSESAGLSNERTVVGPRVAEGGEHGEPDAEQPSASLYTPKKCGPWDSESVIGKCIMGERSVEWPHRQLLDLDEQSNRSAITSFDVSPNGEYVGVGYEDGQVRVWNAQQWQLVLRIKGKHEGSVTTIRFSPDSTRIFTSADSTGVVWGTADALDGRYFEISRLNGYGKGDTIWDMDWSPNSQVIAAGFLDHTVKLFNATSDELTRTLEGPDALVEHVKFSMDGQYLVGCADATGYIWNYPTGNQVGTMEGHTANIWCMSFSHDCKRIATSSQDSTTRIWDAENGQELVILREHAGPVWAVEFSPDGKNIVSGSKDSMVSICDSFLGERRHLLDNGGSAVLSVAYSPRGDCIASSSDDGSIRLWDAMNGSFICKLLGHEDISKKVRFSPKDDAIISSSDDGTVRVWSLVDIFRV